jgi:hypothetical protein
MTKGQPLPQIALYEFLVLMWINQAHAQRQSSRKRRHGRLARRLIAGSAKDSQRGSISIRPFSVGVMLAVTRAFHLISRSARESSVGGISRLRALAVLRLITNSNLVGRSTGKSPGFAPLKILSIKVASRRKISW